MALLFMDSFDHYVSADLAEKWSSIISLNGIGTGAAQTSINATGGRRSSGCLRHNVHYHDTATGAVKTLTPSGTTVVIGAAIKISATFSGALLNLLQIVSGSTPQVSIQVLAARTIRVLRGAYDGTVLGTSSVLFPINTFGYLEVKVLLSTTVGTVDVRLDGVSVLSLTGLNTAATGTAVWTGLVCGYYGSGFVAADDVFVDYDDFYVLDGSGSAPWNTFLGDVRVDARVPTAAGASAAWTPLAGANYLAVDDAAPDDDTTYTSTSTIGATDTFTVQDAPVAGATIFGIQHCLNLKKMDAGSCTVAPVVRHGSTDYPGADIAPGTSYAYGLAINATNPGTGAQWTEAGFNAAEFGYRRTA